MPPYQTARGDKKTTHNDMPTTKGKDCVMRERERVCVCVCVCVVKLKTKHPICNMNFF